MLAFEDVPCIEADMQDVNRVYRSDAQVRLGPEKLASMAFAFVVKRKSGMETYIALHARDIKRSLIYRVDPDSRNVGDPSTQIKSGLDLLKGLGFTLNAVNLKYGAAMLEVVLQDVPVLMTPAKAKKLQLERTATLSALEKQAAFLEENNLVVADEKTLNALPREDRNRYNTAKAAYQKLALEDQYDEQREFLFDHVDALLHGEKPPVPGRAQPSADPAPAAKAPEKSEPETKPAEPAEKKPEPAEKKPESTAPAPEKKVPPETKTTTKIVADPKDKLRIKELEEQAAELKDRLADLEDQRSALEIELKKTRDKLKAAEASSERIKELETELETAHHSSDEDQKEIRRLKSDNAKHIRRIEELEEQQAHASRSEDEPLRPRSRLSSGRSLLSSSAGSRSSSTSAANAPHVVRRPPPAGATFGVDWDLEHLPCSSLDQVVEAYQSICNAQLTLEGYSTQYCSAYIFVLKENGGRQLYMVFNLPQEGRFLIYKPIKKPASSSEIQQLLKEAHKFLQVVGVETERIDLKPGRELPSGELQSLFAEI